MTYTVSLRLGRNYNPGWIYFPQLQLNTSKEAWGLNYHKQPYWNSEGNLTKPVILRMAEKAERRFWVLGDISESLISLSGTCPNSAFPVILGCKFPYYLRHSGFSVKVYYYLQLRSSHLILAGNSPPSVRTFSSTCLNI